MGLKEKAYTTIKERIINCIYPPGSIINGKELILELELSRTPFREAMNELAQEGLVEIVPYKGIYVSEITIKDIDDLYAIRDLLEPFAVELAMDHIPRDVLETYYESLRPYKDMDLEIPLKACSKESVAEDEDLHMMVLNYVNNALLVHTMMGFYDHTHRIRVLSHHKESVVIITGQQHLAIVECMLKGDKAGAKEAMHHHIISSKQRAFDTLLARKDRIYLK
ncbi:MAG TPA: hypothetical protein DD738_00030 [Ruminiclostridium sp.]|jgi:DNA-binding GntR family transcriptional regulator|nr:hypothetical protein [Ruminiclostridium sp.]